MNQQEQIARWQERLEDTFLSDIPEGERLSEIIEYEKDYGGYINEKLRGYRVLTDSFFNFYLDTIRSANIWLSKNSLPQNWSNYLRTLLFYVTIFKSFRAAENLLLCGYPLDGYSLLRDLKDRALFLGAIINGSTTLLAIEGLQKYKDGKSLSKSEHEDIRKERKKEQRRVLQIMTGKKSGLENEHLKELTRWTRMFHEEVHGSRYTYLTGGGGWLRGVEPLYIAPHPMDKQIGMYANRSNEIGWMLLRTLPFLQPTPHAFGEDWIVKWNILDESFRFMVEALDRAGKKIAQAIIVLVDTKFLFAPDNCYSEK